MAVLQESNFSSGGVQGGIKQLLLKMTGPVLDKRQFALCFPVAYSTLFKVFQIKETNNNSIIVWAVFTRLFVAADEARVFCATLTRSEGATLTLLQLFHFISIFISSCIYSLCQS